MNKQTEIIKQHEDLLNQHQNKQEETIIAIGTTKKRNLSFWENCQEKAQLTFSFIKKHLNPITFLGNMLFLIYRFFKPKKIVSQELLAIINDKNHQINLIKEKAFQQLIDLNIQYQHQQQFKQSYFMRTKNFFTTAYHFIKNHYQTNQKLTVIFSIITLLSIIFIGYKSYRFFKPKKN